MTIDNSGNIYYQNSLLDANYLTLVSMNNIPMYFNPYYQYGITIDNKRYILKFKWNAKYSFWTLEFYTNYGELLCTTKLVPEKDIISNYRYKIGLPHFLLYTTTNIGINKEEYPTQFDVEDGFGIVVTNVTIEN